MIADFAMRLLAVGWSASRRLPCGEALLCLLAGAGIAHGAGFQEDLEALTAAPHRLAGTAEGRAAADYMEEQLRQIAGGEVFVHEFPMWQTRTVRCELEIGGRTIPLSAIRPNLTVPPTTPEGGLTGPLVYVGQGRLNDYGEGLPESAIVLIDYDTREDWQHAFSLGARAVIFLAEENALAKGPRHVGIPVNIPRFYLAREDLGNVALPAGGAEATVHSEARWELSPGRNVLFHLPGTDPAFAGEGGETIILSAPLDGFGIVPEKSPAARRAANAAALLESARFFSANRPRRDVLFLFSDNHARSFQGARTVYGSLHLTDVQVEEQGRQHLAEQERLSGIRDVLGDVRGGGAVPDHPGARDALLRQARFSRDDFRQRLARERTALRGEEEPSPEAVARIEAGKERLSALNDALRTLSRGRVNEAEPALVREFAQATEVGIAQRLEELELLIRIDRQRAGLREALGGRRLLLHVAYDFSGNHETWGIAVGDSLERIYPFVVPDVNADRPGYYGRLLQALRGAVAGDENGFSSLATGTLRETSAGRELAGTTFLSEGSVAGVFGVYNLSLVTLHDGRPREGQPADTFENLDWQRIRSQAAEASRLLLIAANSAELSQRRVFSSLAVNEYPSWNNGRLSGHVAGLRVTGGLAEDRPAGRSLMAIWPMFPVAPGGTVRQIWSSQEQAIRLPAHEPVMLELIDSNGRFGVEGARRDFFTFMALLGTRFDERGELTAISAEQDVMRELATGRRATRCFLRANTSSGRERDRLSRGPEPVWPVRELRFLSPGGGFGRGSVQDLPGARSGFGGGDSGDDFWRGPRLRRNCRLVRRAGSQRERPMEDQREPARPVANARHPSSRFGRVSSAGVQMA